MLSPDPRAGGGEMTGLDDSHFLVGTHTNKGLIAGICSRG